MHPQLLSQVASEHVNDLRRDAERHAPAAVPRVPIRRRAGWTLVHIGLRMAASSADG
jgi:hypothetical protein